MHRLIEQARTSVDQAELYWKRAHNVSASYENKRLQQISESDLSSVALRVIHDGKMGSTFAVTPDQPGLIDQAKTAAAYGDSATFSFAPAADYPHVNALDPEAGRLTSEDLVTLCESVLDGVLSKRDDLPMMVDAEMEQREVVIETTEGAEAAQKATDVVLSFGAPIKGAGMPVYKWRGSISPQTKPAVLVSEFLEWYGWTEKKSTPATGRLPVVFSPDASFLYLLPLWAGLEGGAIEKETSPLLGRVGEQILSEKLTIVDDPLEDGGFGCRPFDDEGVPCQRRTLVDQGVLKGYLLDRRTASALGESSTGNAVKRELFSDGTETKPSPWPIRLSIEPGRTSYRDMIDGLDEGLLVYYGMGFHSGNYPQGQFAIQAIGFHVKGGEIVGRLENTMISASIYEDFRNVRALSVEKGPALGFLNVDAPYVLVDSVQVAGT
jgi:PmbA protein